MHTDMTDLAIQWYPELTNIIVRYDIKIKLDQFGFGKCIYCKNEEIGYFVETVEGIEMHYAKDYGLDCEVHDDWHSLSRSIENKISN